MTKCILKKNWTCSAAALELTLASCFLRQSIRLIVHFYSELTSNHPQVFVITSFCNHMWNLVAYCCIKYKILIAFYIAVQMGISDVHIHLKKITYKPYSIICLLYYIIYSGCCHVYICCVKALPCMLWLKLTLFVLQPPLRS